MSLEDKLTAYIEAHKNLIENFNDVLLEATKDFFTETPNLVIGFAGHTPSFNDGDPCTFSTEGWKAVKVPNDDFDVEPFLSYDEIDEAYDYDEITDVPDDVETFVDLLNKIPETILCDHFGDNVTVMITKDGIESEYSDCGR